MSEQQNYKQVTPEIKRGIIMGLQMVCDMGCGADIRDTFRAKIKEIIRKLEKELKDGKL